MRSYCNSVNYKIVGRSSTTNLREQLANAEASLREMEELQYQATNLEAEIQRAKSLQRFLESQVAEG